MSGDSHSTDDTLLVDDLVQQLIAQRPPVVHYNDYLHMLYLLVFAIFYVGYIVIVIHGRMHLFDESEHYYHWDSYEREIPRLFWFSRGYRLA